jgi:formylglycine-generating enzyme required for sulfatase activity
VPVGLYREFATQTHRKNSPVHAPGPSGWFVDPKRSWAAPGFAQEPSHPVTGVSRDDADAFAEWFTRKCRSEGYLLPEHSFRLPTRSEWLSWTGGREYPWGGSWPPGPDEGNYAGPEILGSPEWPAGWRILREPVPGQIRSAPDGYPTTAPAGAGSSVDGFVHLGGNVAEWCLDPYEPTMNRPADLAEDPRLAASNPGWGTVLGGSWLDGNDPPSLRSAFARPFARNQGAIWIGFRLVLVSSPGSGPSLPR